MGEVSWFLFPEARWWGRGCGSLVWTWSGVAVVDLFSSTPVYPEGRGRLFQTQRLGHLFSFSFMSVSAGGIHLGISDLARHAPTHRQKWADNRWGGEAGAAVVVGVAGVVEEEGGGGGDYKAV